MADAINDLDEFIKYRKTLETVVENLEKNLRKTEEAIETVKNEGWDDPKFKEFDKKFAEDKDELLEFCKAVKRLNDEDMEELQKILEEYFGVPMGRPS